MATKPDTSLLSTPLDVLQVRDDFPILHDEHAIGDLGHLSLREIWRGEDMSCARIRHREGHHDAIPLCIKCDERHRP